MHFAPFVCYHAGSRKGIAMHNCLRLLLIAFSLSVVTAQPATATIQAIVTERIVTALDRLEADGDFAAAQTTLLALFDQVAVHAPVNQPEVFRQSALALRLVQQLAEVDEAIRMDVFKFLRANPRLTHAVCFLVKTEHQKPQDVYALLYRLIQMRSDMLERYAPLAAAVCVVHDRTFTRRVNENMTHAPDALYVFDYFVKYESSTSFGIRNMPAELLLYVVDVTAGIDELLWVQERYRNRERDIGKRFFEISYDHRHFRSGTPKRVTEEGYSLPNIQRYGGVCADQAFYAMSVGKAYGVPTTYTSGRSADVSHAWVGYLESDGRSAWWNFNAGRYDAYQGVRGNVMDPQTRQFVPDSHISLLAGLASSDETKRHQAAALVDAALHLREAAKRANFKPPPLNEGPSRSRTVDTAGELALLEAGLRLAPQYAHGWFAVRDLANEGKLSLQQKRHWANALHRLCGNAYLDFQLAILVPMVQSIDDVRQQNALWNSAFDRFSNRHDLAAEIRMHQGRMWENAGNLDRAGVCYEDVILRYANAGHFVVDALHEAERLLRDNGRADLVPTLYANAWSRIDKPQQMAEPFARQSNWSRVGQRYAQTLQQAGRQGDAQNVLRQLGGN